MNDRVMILVLVLGDLAFHLGVALMCLSIAVAALTGQLPPKRTWAFRLMVASACVFILWLVLTAVRGHG